MSKKDKKTRLEYIFGIYSDYYKQNIAKNIYLKLDYIPQHEDPQTLYDYFYDDYFIKFCVNYHEISITFSEKSPMRQMWEFFVDCDPSPNKEYVSWFINLYKNSIKESVVLDHRSTFFEDLLSKVKSSLETFSLLKKTNALSVHKRDINNFKNISEFVNFIRSYTMNDLSDDSVYTLDTKELQCIRNFVEKNGNPGQAELVFENDDWLIVITHDKEANIQFGKYTTWCTAGTRYANMFESYTSRGKLFVLIRKLFGSRKSIHLDPNSRLQFHFQDNMFMDALDKPFDIKNILLKYGDIRDYFTNYITSEVIPHMINRNEKQKVIIDRLVSWGYIDQVIKLIRASKPKTLDFSGSGVGADYLSEIGEITSIETLNLSDCNLTFLPESIQNLTNLKNFKFRNNKNLKTIPDWFNKLTNLEYLDCAGCDISHIGDLSVCEGLNELVLDYNQSLNELPTGIGNLKNLVRLTASSCDLRKIDRSILNCKNLYLLDVHSNKNLTEIPLELSQLPDIVAICIDDTNIPGDFKTKMESNGNGTVTIIQYGV